MKQLTLFFAFLFSLAMPQPLSAQEPQDQKREELRQLIGLDYSMPDYEVSKIDEKKLGPHLASMLRFLEDNFMDIKYNRMLSKIEADQDETMRYGVIRGLKVKNVKKKGNTIAITIGTEVSLSRNTSLSRGVMTITFQDGLSQDATANALFRDFSRFVKMKEQAQ